MLGYLFQRKGVDSIYCQWKSLLPSTGVPGGLRCVGASLFQTSPFPSHLTQAFSKPDSKTKPIGLLSWDVERSRTLELKKREVNLWWTEEFEFLWGFGNPTQFLYSLSPSTCSMGHFSYPTYNRSWVHYSMAFLSFQSNVAFISCVRNVPLLPAGFESHFHDSLGTVQLFQTCDFKVTHSKYSECYFLSFGCWILI